MREKELKKLNRQELLELLLDQSRELERLEGQLRSGDAASEGSDPAPEPSSEKKASPKTALLESELGRVRYRRRYRAVLRNTVFTLITVAAIAVLVATLWMPVLQIYGASMTPSLHAGDIVVSVKSGKHQTGDIIAFYYNNKILVKRVIAGPGDWVDIDKDGTVFVNNKKLEEPYLTEKALGECNIELPYQVPESRLFVMGDHRSVSVDSRNKSVGCVAEEQIVGRIVLRIWPIKKLGDIQ